MQKPAVFIDRDGTLNEQMGYINHVSRFVLLPGTAEAIRLLNRHQYLAIIILTVLSGAHLDRATRDIKIGITLLA